MDPPSIVEITITRGPRGRTFSPRLRIVVAGLLAALLVGGAVVALTGRGSDTGSLSGAYREPLRCANSVVSGAWPSEIDRSGACWHYGVNLTTILRYVHGDWQMALAARSPACPNPLLPTAVRAQLVFCRR